MSTTFTVLVDDQQVQAFLGGLKGRLGNLRPLNKAIAEALTQSTKARFLTARAPDGTPWKPLAESTRRLKKGPGILRESEELYASIVPSWDDTSAGISSDRIYGLWHQQGTKPYVIRAKPGKALRLPGLAQGPATKEGEGAMLYRREVNHPGLPARRFFGISEQDRTEIIALGEDYLALRAPGLVAG